MKFVGMQEDAPGGQFMRSLSQIRSRRVTNSRRVATRECLGPESFQFCLPQEVPIVAKREQVAHCPDVVPG